MNNTRRRLFLYSAIVFLSSGALLVLEIVAGRLLAPYIGVSLYTWTSIIGVILAGLSLGNWFGGRWADGGGTEKDVGLVLIAAGVWCVISLILLSELAQTVVSRGLSLLTTSFLLTSVLFFIPAVLLGVVTPMLTTLSLRLDDRTGHVVGRMHALAAMGSIGGTFATGYWLIQAFGTYAVVLGTAVCLFIQALPLVWGAKKTSAATLAGISLVAAFLFMSNPRAPCDRESQYFCIRIADHSSDAPWGTAKGLVLDHLLHSINHEQDPSLIIAPYVHAMDEIVRNHYGAKYDEGLDYFFAGGGAYTQPRIIAALSPDSRITVAELDPAVTESSMEYMYLDSRGMNIVHDDARRVLQRQEKSFDVIVGDVFHDVAIPFHLVTREFFELAKARLTEGGILTLNVVDAFPDPRLVKSVINALDQVFERTAVYVDQLPDKTTRVTYVITARDGSNWPPLVTATRGIPRSWFRIDEPMRETGSAMEALPVLSDNYAPVESLIAELLTGANH